VGESNGHGVCVDVGELTELVVLGSDKGAKLRQLCVDEDACVAVLVEDLRSQQQQPQRHVGDQRNCRNTLVEGLALQQTAHHCCCPAAQPTPLAMQLPSQMPIPKSRACLADKGTYMLFKKKQKVKKQVCTCRRA
jgi:hypothetical protein